MTTSTGAYISGWPGHELPRLTESQVNLTTLTQPPAGRRPAIIPPLVAREKARTIPVEGVDWVPRDVADDGRLINYVPVNRARWARFTRPGSYLATNALNSCIAVGAAFRQANDALHAFLGHYDPEHVREIGPSGRLRISELLTRFAGSQATKAVIAYPISQDLPQILEESYHPSDFPVGAIVEDALRLPAGSDVLLVPYQTSLEDCNSIVEGMYSRTFGHTMHVGLSPTDLMQFGWNGERIAVGDPEIFDKSREGTARAVAAGVVEKLEFDMRLYSE